MKPIVVASLDRPPAILRFLASMALVVAAFVQSGLILGAVGFTPVGRALYASVFLLLLLVGFSGLLFLLDKVRSPLLAAGGLPTGRGALRDAASGIGVGVAAVSGVVGIVALAGRVQFAYIGVHPAAILLSLWALVAAAMVEEITFRGYPLHRLMEALGTPAAVIATSCLFGMAHLRNPHASMWGALNTAEIGLLLAIAYVRTRSLWLPWGIHFGWNLALGMGYGLVVSGYSDFSAVVVGKTQGPRWLTGGEYGIEASATATVVILLIIMVLLAMVKSRPAPAMVLGGSQLPENTSDSEPMSGIQ